MDAPDYGIETKKALPFHDPFGLGSARLPAAPALPPVAPAPSPQRSVTRQEPAREEVEVDSPGPLSLAIGKGKEIFTISD